MTQLNVDFERLRLAHKTVRAELLAERTAIGNWRGCIASSPVATATAISALVVAHRGTEAVLQIDGRATPDDEGIDHLVQGSLSELFIDGLHWLARMQLADGGWGDSVGARSNLAATALVLAAFRLTGVPARYTDLLDSADKYVAREGGIAGLKQGTLDKVWIASVLANCALAGIVPWRQVPPLPFEQVCHALGRDTDRAGPGHSGYEIAPRWSDNFDADSAMLLAAGLAKFHFDPPRNPFRRFVRRRAVNDGIEAIARLQAADGSFLAAPIDTALIIMSLGGSGHCEHPVVSRGVEFLLASMRADASWPMLNDLAIRNTALAIQSGALASDEQLSEGQQQLHESCLDWLLSCQNLAEMPENVAGSAGWSWSDSLAALPSVGDTAGALMALTHWRRGLPPADRDRVEQAVRCGINWLLAEQNDVGSWPSAERVGTTPAVAAGTVDSTSDTLCALASWRRYWRFVDESDTAPKGPEDWLVRIDGALVRGFDWLAGQQTEEGSFAAQSFSDEHVAEAKSHVYGTSRVLAACAELGRLDADMAQRAAGWLARAQHAGGGWGPPRTPIDYSGAYPAGSNTLQLNKELAKSCSVEETAWAVSALLLLADVDPVCRAAAENGLAWLAAAVEDDRHRQPAVAGVWQTKLWYYERLYPLAFAAGALERAMQEFAPKRQEAASLG